MSKVKTNYKTLMGVIKLIKMQKKRNLKNMLSFDHLKKIYSEGRRPRHGLANQDYNLGFLLEKYVKDAQKGDIDAWQVLCRNAISGSTDCQKVLVTMADQNVDKVIEELNRAMDYYDQGPICDVCTSTDICGCDTGSCPACHSFKCKEYACRMHLPGAKEAYLSTIGVKIPVRRHPTTVMDPVYDGMGQAVAALFNAGALPFPSKDDRDLMYTNSLEEPREERSGLEHCTVCNSCECEHCVCVICDNVECTHFFMRPRMNAALYVAWRNADWPYRLLDGKCVCRTCNTKFNCPDWDINPSINCCDGDCDVECDECKTNRW
jgi:hypothetical protein